MVRKRKLQTRCCEGQMWDGRQHIDEQTLQRFSHCIHPKKALETVTPLVYYSDLPTYTLLLASDQTDATVWITVQIPKNTARTAP